ncbi:YceI family protein [Rhodoblastus sp.]|jgi:polyisoprenoid-binding protein YceI|uniref:YceI family protein n=1 Tax=Rhodoblastus sp. TaxID=1962975 RepID=UPI00261AEA59|nr:YceI family protein [Rhodoblastus sp.]
MKFATALGLALLTASAARAAEWKVSPADSALAFTGTQTGANFTGRFSRFDAQISLDPDKPDDARIVVTVDVASAATGDKQRDTALPGQEWFDVAHFPQARFESRRVTRAANGYEAVGDLTLRGVTKEIHLPFTLEIDGRKAHAKGHVDLKRDLFGVGQGDWASGDWVGLDVAVDFDLKAERAD